MTAFARTPWVMAWYMFCAGMFAGLALAELDGGRDVFVVALCAVGSAANALGAYVWRPS